MTQILKMILCVMVRRPLWYRVGADTEKTVENYIVRIYRFQKNNPRQLVGIVESVENEGREKRAFTNLDDLWEILNSQMSETAASKQGDRQDGQGIHACESSGYPEGTGNGSDC